MKMSHFCHIFDLQKIKISAPRIPLEPLILLAERERFELSEPLTAHTISSRITYCCTAYLYCFISSNVSVPIHSGNVLKTYRIPALSFFYICHIFCHIGYQLYCPFADLPFLIKFIFSCKYKSEVIPILLCPSILF